MPGTFQPGWQRSEGIWAGVRCCREIKYCQLQCPGIADIRQRHTAIVVSGNRIIVQHFFTHLLGVEIPRKVFWRTANRNL